MLKKALFSTIIFPLLLFSQETTFLCIRHGQTDSNIGNKTSKDKDIPLNEKGLEQAKNTAQKLLKLHPDIKAIYSSDLQRAQSTALETAKLFNLSIQKEDAFRELRSHSLKKKKQKIETTDKDILRIEKVLSSIAKKYQGEKIAIFSHGGVLRVLFAWIENTSITSCQFSNCDILIIGYDPEKKEKTFRIIEVDRRN